MTKRTGSPLLNKDFFHHLNQFAVVENLLHDVWVGLSIVFTIRKTTLPAHFITPLRIETAISRTPLCPASIESGQRAPAEYHLVIPGDSYMKRKKAQKNC